MGTLHAVVSFFFCVTVSRRNMGSFLARWTGRRACLPTESLCGRDWAKAQGGVVFASSGLDETFMGGAAMPVTVKSISLWRKEVENQVGSLAHTLEPVTRAGASLHVLVGYRYPGEGTKAAIELY